MYMCHLIVSFIVTDLAVQSNNDCVKQYKLLPLHIRAI